MSPALHSHFVEYARHHATRGNPIRHYLAIPRIVLWALAKATGRA